MTGQMADGRLQLVGWMCAVAIAGIGHCTMRDAKGKKSEAMLAPWVLVRSKVLPGKRMALIFLIGVHTLVMVVGLA